MITQVEAPSVARATVAVAGCVEADSGSVNKFLVLEMPHISTISRDPAAVFIFYMTAGPHRLQQPRRHRDSREINVPALVFNYKQII